MNIFSCGSLFILYLLNWKSLTIKTLYWNQTEIKYSSSSRATYINEISIGIILWGCMHQVMLLWDAYLKVYLSLKANWHQSTVLYYCTEGFLINILAVNVYCEDWIPLLGGLLGGVLSHHVLDHPSWNSYRKHSLVILNFLQKLSLLLDPSCPSGWPMLCCLGTSWRGKRSMCLLPSSLFRDLFTVEMWILQSCYTLICVGVNGCRGCRGGW